MAMVIVDSGTALFWRINEMTIHIYNIHCHSSIREFLDAGIIHIDKLYRDLVKDRLKDLLSEVNLRSNFFGTIRKCFQSSTNLRLSKHLLTITLGLLKFNTEDLECFINTDESGSNNSLYLETRNKMLSDLLKIKNHLTDEQKTLIQTCLILDQ